MRFKTISRSGRAAACLTFAAVIGLPGCGGDSSGTDDNASSPPSSQPTYAAQIQRTEFGIPHITAEDYKGLGYGLGYAFAQDNICSLAREIVVARGESALYLGVNQGNVASDIFYTWYNDADKQQALLAAQPQDVRDAVQGYAAGYSRYLRDTGRDNIDASCAGEPWVREIDETDLAAVYNKGNLRGGLSNFVGPIVAAAPPSAAPAQRVASNEAAFDMTAINVTAGGSNAYALGSTVTENGRGMLYGNPHEPWDGVQRFYEMHLTLPGELDVMGVGQQGQPFPNIGFNKDIAWSHTVSTAKRFTLYQLQLVDGDPLKYRYENADGDVEERDIREVDVTVQLPGGQSQTGSVYVSHFGPMLAVNLINGQLPAWGDNNLAFAIRDAASENPRAIAQWLSMDKATSVEDLVARLKETIGLPFVNTIATDRYGKAMYADLSTVPHVTGAKLQACAQSGGPFVQVLVSFDLPALDGSTADCEWGSDDDSPQAGIFGGSNLPVLIRDDYVTNSNDSYWLSNPDEPLTGFSPLLRRRLLGGDDPTVPEALPRLLRTRMGLIQVQDRLSGADGLGGNKFTLDNLQTVVYGNRSYAAELVRDDVVTDCQNDPQLPLTDGGTIDATAACDALANWDARDNLDSRGAHVFREFWENVAFSETTDTVFNIKFDKNDPVNTPRDLVINEQTRQALGDAIKLFQDRGVTFDAELGDLQYVVDDANGDERIPMHGGLGREGIFNVADGPGLTDDGDYAPIDRGPTYMQTVSFDDDGPVAEALLAFSQSADPSRPFHRDQTRRYSTKQWVELPFSPEEIEAKAIGEKLELSE